MVGGLGAHAAFVLRATDRNLALSENLIELVLPILLIVSANYVTKLRSNFFIGIRTPWTLSSEFAWRRTHRVGGRVLMLLGLVLIPPAFLLDAGTNGWVTGLALLGVGLGLVVYSYFAWRNDPTSHSSGRTLERRQHS